METPLHDLNALRQAIRQGLRPKYLFFWGHQPLKDGSIGASCLSQWFTAPFTIEGLRYPTAEHFMMTEKARLFNDPVVCNQILEAPHPGAAKKLGRHVKGFDDTTWKAHRFDIVVRANYAKFGQNEALRAYLLGTKNRIIVEASPVDRIWGIGLARDDQRSQNPEQWRGLNLLGFALMRVRQELRN